MNTMNEKTMTIAAIAAAAVNNDANITVDAEEHDLTFMDGYSTPINDYADEEHEWEACDNDAADEWLKFETMRRFLDGTVLSKVLARAESPAVTRIIIYAAVKSAARRHIVPKYVDVEFWVCKSYSPATWEDPEEYDMEDEGEEWEVTAKWLAEMMEQCIEDPGECL